MMATTTNLHKLKTREDIPIRIKRLHKTWITLLAICCITLLPESVFPDSGCSDGTTEGLHDFKDVSACTGSWAGHIDNSRDLCADGWRVCTYLDVELLRNISWLSAVSVKGCMAIDAAQDGGTCLQCRDDLSQDDMAGLGSTCPHHSLYQSSCISAGRIDASCCVDSHFHSACHFKPWMTGVVCCRLPVKRPHIVVKPAKKIRVFKDFIFLMSCRAVGMPPPVVDWYKNGKVIKTHTSRISAHEGDLIISQARRKDSGVYTCRATNSQGVDSATSQVFVKRYKSGCADGTTDGFHLKRDIQACAGVWKGHVKFAKPLCSKGWKVCSSRDRKAISKLQLSEVKELSGCFAMDAALKNNKCGKCFTKGEMIEIGGACGEYKKINGRSPTNACVYNFELQTFIKSKTRVKTCEYNVSRHTGVLCCRIKNKKRRKTKNKNVQKECVPVCANGGECLSYNRCKCLDGYKGARCQIPKCQPNCGSKGKCVRPNLCECKPGYTGKTCRQKNARCSFPCLNGGRCVGGRRCKCSSHFRGKLCQYVSGASHVLLSRMNRTEK